MPGGQNTKVRANVVFWIKERFDKKPTKGGSSFDALVIGDQFANKCAVTDHFNGNYSVCCDMQETCMNVTLTLMYVNFTAYMSYRNLMGTNLFFFFKKICVSYSYTSSSAHKNNEVANTNEYEKKQGSTRQIRIISRSKYQPGLWTYADNIWQWIGDGTKYNQPSKANLDECLAQLHTVYMYGDSHMRFYFMYILSILGAISSAHHSKFTHEKIKNVIFQATNYSTVLAGELTKLMQSNMTRTSVKKDVLILTAGCWDIAFSSMEVSLISVNKLVRIVNKLKRHPRWSHANLIWMTIPPFTNHEAIDYQNNYNRAAVNAYIIPLMNKIGFTVIDVYPILNTFNNAVVDRAHYISFSVMKTQLIYKQGAAPVNKLLHYCVARTIFSRATTCMKIKNIMNKL